MKVARSLTGILLGLLLVPGAMRAQSQGSPGQSPAMTHLRVDIVLTEFSGEKKINSLPYTMYVGVRDKDHSAGKESLRMGVRVPIGSAESFNYQNIGTNIDCWASGEEDGRYRIEGEVDRSSVYSPDDASGGNGQTGIAGGHPILRSFNSGFDLVLHDGETGEGISATDPFNGHVLKVSVTIHVVK